MWDQTGLIALTTNNYSDPQVTQLDGSYNYDPNAPMASQIANSPGAWQVAIVPIPAAFWLFGSVVAAGLAFARKQRMQAAASKPMASTGLYPARIAGQFARANRPVFLPGIETASFPNAAN